MVVEVPSPTKNCVLVTGGAGYIGSHICVLLLNRSYDVVIVDNLANSNIERIKRAYGKNSSSLHFHKVDMTNIVALEEVFRIYDFKTAIHLAGFKAVGESVLFPLKYYKNNIASTVNLLELMEKYNTPHLIYSSSATVYGYPKIIPIPEECPTGPLSPYGKTKLICEDIIRDQCTSSEKNTMKAISLRYFNPVGAHESGLLGEDPKGVPNNLMPLVAQVASGKRTHVQVFGFDYKTKDGTGLRDYIHVMDLAQGHLAAMDKLTKMDIQDSAGDKDCHPRCNYKTYNLGTGQGYTVLDMIEAMQRMSNMLIPYKIEKRRPGDVDVLLSDPSLANEELGWKSKYDLDRMCQDLWRWTTSNANQIKKLQ